MTATFHSSIK